MSRTKDEIRAFLGSKVGTIVPHPGYPDLNGQCVTLTKALLEFLGVPNPYKARGNARDAGDTYLREGIASNGVGWLTIVVNRDMGLIDGVRYGHIWIDLQNEANYESNGVRALYTTKNTRPISQGQQFINLDKWIKENNMPTLIDEEGVRILAVGVLNRPEPLTTTPDLKSHIGGDALAKIKEFWYSPEGRAANKWQQAAPGLIAAQSDAINTLNKKVSELSERPTKEELEAVRKAAEEAQAARDSADKARIEAEEALGKLEESNKQDQETGNSFLRWLGNQLNKLTGDK